MAEVTQETGKCEECGSEIKLDEAWRVDEKYFCQNCFEKLDV
jgi:formylmethanofuran dehydrogenase subunit E